MCKYYGFVANRNQAKNYVKKFSSCAINAKIFDKNHATFKIYW